MSFVSTFAFMCVCKQAQGLQMSPVAFCLNVAVLICILIFI